MKLNHIPMIPIDHVVIRAEKPNGPMLLYEELDYIVWSAIQDLAELSERIHCDREIVP